MLIKVKNKDTLLFDDFIFRCVVGKKGISAKKVEGDFCTPKGSFKLKTVFYRSDRVKNIKTKDKIYLDPHVVRSTSVPPRSSSSCCVSLRECFVSRLYPVRRALGPNRLILLHLLRGVVDCHWAQAHCGYHHTVVVLHLLGCVIECISVLLHCG